MNEEIKYELDVLTPHEKVQALTNKFLAEFFELVAATEGKSKRDDSFAYHYILPTALVYSDFFQDNDIDNDLFCPLLGMSTLSEQLTKGEFQYKTRFMNRDVSILAERFMENKNDRHSVELVSDIIKEKEYMDIQWGPNNEMKLGNVMRNYRELTLRIFNSGNEMDLNLVIEFMPDEKEGIPQQHGINHIDVYKGTEKILSRSGRKTEICHFRYTPEINGFFMAMDQILFAINNPDEF